MSVNEVRMSQWPSDQDYVIPVAPGPDIATVTIDGTEVQVPRGELLIKVAQEHGTYIPRFCWHERMKPVGMCRMCLVEVEGMRGLQISCATPVTDGMVVTTQSPGVKAAQDGVLEFLLVNHPLDCPVCDRGGECPLQDQTLAFGPGESRFVEEKRHFEKPVAISETVLLDRERCIQCGRCTRFSTEVAGDSLIHFGGRGSSTEVITAPDEPFSSYFAGNTVQICPVGALTASPYRFRARPWDLESVETSCQQCSVGCRGALESTSNRLVRLLGVDLDGVNQGWLCDRGRYAYEWVHSESRVTSPLVRRGGVLTDATWPQALDLAADALRGALDAGGPGAIGVLGGARGTNEDAYAWARLAKGVLATDNVDAQLGDGLPPEVVLGGPRARIDDLDGAAAIVVLAPDLEETVPVLYLRVRHAALERGVPVVDVAPRDNGLTGVASLVLRHLPGEVGPMGVNLAAVLAGRTTQTPADALAAHLEGRDGPIVVVLGRPSLAEPVNATVHAAAQLAAVPGVRFLSALHRGNVHGALDLGLAPGFLPGRVTLAAGGAHVAAHWGRVPDAPGLDAAGILAAAADGTIRTLVLLGADPLADFPDRALATAALDRVEQVIVVGAFADDAGDHATVVLPVTVWGEQDGTTTNLEGRVQRVARAVTPGGTAMEAWRVAGELAARLGADFDLELLGEVQDEIARVAPAFVGVDAVLLRRARDGVVLPLHDHAHEITWGPAPLGAGVSWEPIPSGADAEPGEDAAGEDATAGPPEPPVALHTWAGPADPAPVVPIDGYALRLVASRTLYGTDRAVVESPSLAQLAPLESVLLVNRIDRDRIGVADGGLVRVTSARGTVEIAVQADPATAQGTAFLAANRRGPGIGELVDPAEAVTDLRVETLR